MCIRRVFALRKHESVVGCSSLIRFSIEIQVASISFLSKAKLKDLSFNSETSKPCCLSLTNKRPQNFRLSSIGLSAKIFLIHNLILSTADGLF